MLKEVIGNLLEANAEALVNTVNTVGVMGKGIALQFRQAFPENYQAYQKACKHNEVKPGHMFVYKTGLLTNPRFIINFPTKRHWMEKARMEDIKSGLRDLMAIIKREGIRSVAVPPLGCGSGGLDWNKVCVEIKAALKPLSDVQILLYAPAGAPAPEKMKVRTQRPNMTPGRAVLLEVLKNYAMPGYRLALLEVQKLAYFVQEAGQSLNLQFAKAKYGPYTETLHHVLQRMEGHFIRGYGDRSRSASIQFLPGAIKEADDFLSEHPEIINRLKRVSQLIKGFETPYGLELLSTVHWLAKEDPRVKTDINVAIDDLQAWSERKKQLFRPSHIKAAWLKLQKEGWI